MDKHATHGDYQYLRDFVDRLEREHIIDPKKLSESEVEKFWDAFGRAYPGSVEVASRWAETLWIFFTGVVAALILLYCFRVLTETEPTLNNSPPRATISSTRGHQPDAVRFA